MFKAQNGIYNEKSHCFIEMNFISIFNMITSIYSELLIHVTTKVTEVTHTGPWNDKYCPVVQINILLTIITAMLSSRANFTDLDYEQIIFFIYILHFFLLVVLNTCVFLLPILILKTKL